MDERVLDTIVIRYDGKDAENHILNLHSLGESIQGSARIIATCAHFLVTFKYTKQLQAHDVTVVAKEPEANCFELTVLIEKALQSHFLTGIGGSALTALISYIIAKQSNSTKEMKHLKEVALKALESAAGKNDKTVEKLLSTIEKMASGLRASSRKAVGPVGEYCDTMKIGDQTAIPIDKAKKDAIISQEDEEIIEAKTYNLLFTEIDLENQTGKVRLTGEDSNRLNVAITDPIINKRGNDYVEALALKNNIKVRAKAAQKDGDIVKLYISELAEN